MLLLWPRKHPYFVQFNHTYIQDPWNILPKYRKCTSEPNKPCVVVSHQRWPISNLMGVIRSWIRSCNVWPLYYLLYKEHYNWGPTFMRPIWKTFSCVCGGGGIFHGIVPFSRQQWEIALWHRMAYIVKSKPPRFSSANTNNCFPLADTWGFWPPGSWKKWPL